ncbi:FmdE family protein [Intestinibacter sp.]
MKYDKNLWEETTKYHGHKCPGIAMGFKICEAAIKNMDIKPLEDEVVCISENNTCPADAVRFILGCNEDNGRLYYRPTEKLAFSFFNKSNGQKLKIEFKPLNRDENISKDEFMNYILETDIDTLMNCSEPTYEF